MQNAKKRAKSPFCISSTFPCAVMLIRFIRTPSLSVYRDIRMFSSGVRLNTVHPSVSVTAAVSISSSDSLYSLLNRLQNIAASEYLCTEHATNSRARTASRIAAILFIFVPPMSL